MKYKILDRVEFRGFVIHVYEVLGKDYLMIRIFKSGSCAKQIFANVNTWMKHVDDWIGKGA